MQFDEFEMKEYVCNALKDLNFTKLTNIQKELLKKKNKNLMACSKTGSGKTHAFLIPIFNMLNENVNTVQATIIAPTKELASQTFKFAKHIASFSKKEINIKLFQGGTFKLNDIEKLNVQPQIVIGTPGRIKDLVINANELKIYTSKIIVFDEADMAFDSGFFFDTMEIIEICKDAKKWVFSATFNEEVKKMLSKNIDNLEILEIKETNQNIIHTLLPIKSADKYHVFLQLTKCINPYLALVFVNTKQRADELYNKLIFDNLNVCILHGGLDSRERKRIMKDIHDLKYQYVIATDVAARGIDILGISHVINYDLPSDFEFYIHRTGRTGRASMSGEAVSLYDFDNINYLKHIEERGIKFVYKSIKNNELIPYKSKKNINTNKKIIEKNTPRYLRKRK